MQYIYVHFPVMLLGYKLMHRGQYSDKARINMYAWILMSSYTSATTGECIIDVKNMCEIIL